MSLEISPIEAMAELLTAAARDEQKRADLAPWVREHHEAFGGMAMLPALPALWAAALAETHDSDFTAQGPPYFMRDLDLVEWVHVLRREDVPEDKTSAVQRFRWHQFGDEEMIRTARLYLDAGQIKDRLGIDSIRGQWDAWVFEDFLFSLPDGVQCVLTHKMERSSGESEGFYLEVEAPEAGKATEECLILLGLGLEDADWTAEGLVFHPHEVLCRDGDGKETRTGVFKNKADAEKFREAYEARDGRRFTLRPV
ncbi:MAG: hypothetical protein QNK37_35025 [Acidobacteriota bacterium]|nr:hypothetical protein [Acidobacteriota bacterium]